MEKMPLFCTGRKPYISLFLVLQLQKEVRPQSSSVGHWSSGHVVLDTTLTYLQLSCKSCKRRETGIFKM